MEHIWSPLWYKIVIQHGVITWKAWKKKAHGVTIWFYKLLQITIEHLFVSGQDNELSITPDSRDYDVASTTNTNNQQLFVLGPVF